MTLALLALTLVPTRGLPTETVSFSREVMAVLSKAGCNAGTCHGNRNGKGGFKLSLRGQDPAQDYLTLSRDALARRVNLLEPARSLMLLKPTTQIAHEGGRRFHQDSLEYELLRRWIAQGLPNDLASAPALQSIEVTPSEAVLLPPTNQVQLHVRAKFDDGTARDVTTLSVFEPVGADVSVSTSGTAERAGPAAPGEATILVRYLTVQAPVRLIFVPDRPNLAWRAPPSRNYIDERIFAKLQLLRTPPSELCSDSVFLRRAYLDLLGLLPTAEEARAFVRDSTALKREQLVDRLLRRPEFSDAWSLKWADLLRVEAHSLDQKGVQNFHHWIRQSVATNKPLDQFVRELVTARGSTYRNPAANYYRPNRDPAERAKAAAQIFLGVRLRCAECHNHPFDRWTQDDYYDWASVFSRVQYKVIENNREIGSDQHEWKGEQVVYLARQGTVLNPRTHHDATARLLGGPDVTAREDPLVALADWLTSHPQFARVQANRIWAQLMGRGLVDPPDDFRATNPPTHPDLLDALAADLAEHHFDARHLIRRIMNSSVYQLASEPTGWNSDDRINYSHNWVRRLEAEALLDCQSQVTGTPLRWAHYPVGLRAAQLPGVRPEGKNQRRTDALDQFLETFGKPPRLLSTDTERSDACNMNQAFQMLSGPTVQELLVAPGNRLSQWLASGRLDSEILEELYWTAFTRPPTAEEARALLKDLSKTTDRRQAWEDLFWGLLNAKEFLFRP